MHGSNWWKPHHMACNKNPLLKLIAITLIWFRVYKCRICDCQVWVVLPSRATRANRAALISHSVALSHTPDEAASPRTRGQCIAWNACSDLSFSVTKLYCLVTQQEATQCEKHDKVFTQWGRVLNWISVYEASVRCPASCATTSYIKAKYTTRMNSKFLTSFY